MGEIIVIKAKFHVLQHKGTKFVIPSMDQVHLSVRPFMFLCHLSLLILAMVAGLTSIRSAS